MIALRLISILFFIVILHKDRAVACPCTDGDNNGECGICLKLISSDECPSDPDLTNRCTPDEVAIGELCEGSNECGTDNSVSNCDIYDIYRRIPCDGMSSLPGDNNGECGICLELISSDDCPSDPDLTSHCTPDEVAVGELCEADDDECGTDNSANNCGSYEIYRRISCSSSPKTPATITSPDDFDLTCHNPGGAGWGTYCYQDGYPYMDSFTVVTCLEPDIEQEQIAGAFYGCACFVGPGAAPRTVDDLNQLGYDDVCNYCEPCKPMGKPTSVFVECVNMHPHYCKYLKCNKQECDSSLI